MCWKAGTGQLGLEELKHPTFSPDVQVDRQSVRSPICCVTGSLLCGKVLVCMFLLTVAAVSMGAFSLAPVSNQRKTTSCWLVNVYYVGHFLNEK